VSNVLLMVSDEHNPRVSEPYGHPMVQTPHMARLADEGTLYQNAYCSSPLCMPSRSAFISGRWVHDIQTYSNSNAGMETFTYPSYGAVLAEQGVHTVHIGKTDVYRPGADLGFSEMILPQDRTPPGDTYHGRTPLTLRTGAAERADGFGPRTDIDPFAPDIHYVNAALDWLDNRASQIDGPWLLSVNLNEPHFPQWVTPELWDMYPQGGDLPTHGRDCASANHPYALDLRAHFETDQFSEQQVRGLRRGYLGCVTWTDRQLGKLLDTLERLGLREDTDVIYSSDHGEMLGKFGMWWKCSLLDDSVRVPLIAAGPHFDQETVTTPVQHLDLQAALFDCLGCERPNWPGDSLLSLQANDPQRIVFAEYHGHGTRSGAFMVRRGRWKLIYCLAAPHLLYDLQADPEELVDRAADQPEIVNELTQALRRVCSPEIENDRAHAFERHQLDRVVADGGTVGHNSWKLQK